MLNATRLLTLLAAACLVLAAAPIYAQATPTANPTPRPSPTEVDADAVAAAILSTTNVRSGPDTRFSIVGRVSSGDEASVSGRDAAGRWLYVTAPVTGWIPAFAAQIAGEVLALPVSIPETTDTPDAAAPSAAAYGVVNVRAEPAITAAIVGQLQAGESAIITGRSGADNDWLLIRMGTESQPGWVAYFTVRVTGTLDTLPILGADSDGQVIVPADQIARALFNVRLRALPSTDAVVLRIIPFGYEIVPLARSADDDWLYLSYAGATGWGAVELFELSADGFAALPIFDPGSLTSTPAATPATTPEATPEG